MTLFARIIHTIGFEVFGVLIFTPFAVFILNESVMTIGVLAIAISIVAMLWNLIYNYIFDLLENKLGRDRIKRGIFTRINHALLFELGLLIITLPFIAYWLHMGILEALLIDISFVVFYVIYAFVYNFIFDKIYFGYVKPR
jgi:uncharacterized membrane protein